MKNRAKKMLAGLLSAAMVFGAVPSEAFAGSNTFIIGSRVVPGQDEAVENTEAVGSIDGVLPAEINAEGNLTILGGTYRLDVTTAVGAIGLDAQGIAVEAQDGAPDTSALNNDLTGRLFYAPYVEGGYALDARTQVTSFAFEKAEGTDTYALQVYAGEEKLNPAEGTLLLIVSEMNVLQADAEQTELATEETGTEVTEPETDTAEVTEPGTEAAGTEVQPEVTETETEAIEPEATETEIQTEAAESETEALTEAATEAVTEAAETEVQTEAVESETEAQTEAVTEAAEPETEALTEAATEEVTEAAEPETEAQTAAVEIEVTETEPITEAAEPETEAPTEAATEAVTEAAETETQVQTEAEVIEPETEAPETEIMTEMEAVTEAESESETEEIVDETEGISEAVVFEAPTEDGKIVKLSAPEGAFPVPASEVTMTAEPLTEEQKAVLEEQLAAMAEADGMKVTEYVAYDINLWVNGEIIQPLLPVQVTFENVAVAQESEDVPEDMSAVETSGFQMDTDTNEITSVNDTTVADDATPEDATVAVEVNHFTITGSFFTQVDPTNPNNYVFSLEQTDDGTQEDGETEDDEASSGEFVTFEVNVESLKGIGEGELTLVPSVVDGTEEDGEAAEGEAEGTPVEVPFQADGEEIEEVTNPTALNASQNWKQRIQIPVSELEGVKNPMLNLSLMSGGNNIATINSDIATITTFSGFVTLNSGTKDKLIEIIGNSTITVSGEYKGAIEIRNNSTVTIQGNGTINAKDRNRSAIYIKSGTVILKDNVTITGGTGTDMENANMEPRGNNTFKVGGGVYVKSGTFNLEGGEITGNTAQRGGGIFVNNGAYFTMTGGTVSNNQTVDGGRPKFAGEGGGIFVYGTATISGGSITGNICNSQTDLGGGGLYVNNNGIATLINATVTNNTAYGFGGGIAGCCHGEMSIVATDGVALYNNTANGQTHAQVDGKKGANGVAEIIDHYNAAFGAGIRGSNSKDFYTAGSTIISNYMTGGGSANYTVYAGKEGRRIANRIIKDNEVIKYESTDVALVANPTQESINKVPGGVTISENTSTVHGGGIGCNGGLYFGSAEKNTIKIVLLDIGIPAMKQLNWGSTGLKGDDYTFELLTTDQKKVLATTTNDKNGNVTFNLNGYVSNLIPDFDPLENPTYTFFLREKIPSNANKQLYDQSMYKIVVNFKSTVETKTETLKHTTTNNGFKEITVTYMRYTFTPEKTTITKVRDENGNEIINSATSATFNNKAAVSIVVNKKGDNNKPLAEAVFELYSDVTCTTKIGDAVTTGSDGKVSWSIIPTSQNETVYAKEITPPPGHSIVGNGITAIPLNTTANTVNSSDIPNTAGSFEVSKVNLGGDKLAGADFVISTDKNGSSVMSTIYNGELKWTSQAGSDYEVKGLAAGTYWLVETEAPVGYEKAVPQQFTVKEDGTLEGEATSITVTDIQNEVQISKLIYGTDMSLSGAGFSLITDGEVVNTWTSDGSNWVVKGLIVNKEYTLEETTVPAGYTKAPTITFKVNENGEVYNVKNAANSKNEGGVGYITVTDKLTEMQFAKVDADGSYVSGATLAIQKKTTDASGKEVYTTVKVEPTYSEAGVNGGRALLWTSGTAPVTIKGLTVGEEYYLTEIAAPDGYQRNPDREKFTVGEKNDVVIKIEDVKTVVKIVKTFDPGYTLKEGEHIEFTISEHEGDVEVASLHYGVKNSELPKTVTLNADESEIEIEGLTAGKTYDLEETYAPDNFIKDVKKQFFIPSDMKNATEVALTKVNVTNKATEFKVSKKSLIDGQEEFLPDAHLQIFVADETGNKTDEIANTPYGGKLEWSSEGSAKVIYGLAPGNYILHEDVAVDGYTLAEDIPFHLDVVYDGKNGEGRTVVKLTSEKGRLEGNEIIMTDKLTEREFAKVDPDGNPVPGAVLEIRKATSDGKVGEEVPTIENDGIVKGADYVETSWTTDGSEFPHRITGLKKGTYYLVEKEAPAGFTVAKPIKFVVDGDEKSTQSLITVTMVDELSRINIRKVTKLFTERTDSIDLAITRDPEGQDIVTLTNYRYPNGKLLKFNTHMNGGIGFNIYGLTPGDYYLVELDAPTGYAKNVQPFSVIGNQPVGTVQIVTLMNFETRVQIEKVFERGKMKDGDEVVFEITPADGHTYDDNIMKGVLNADVSDEKANTWLVTVTNKTGADSDRQITEDGRNVYVSDIIYGLPVGEYTLTEISAPAGYRYAKPITFTVTEEMNGKAGDEQDSVLTVLSEPVMNDTTKVAFEKVDERGAGLADVQLMVLDATGKTAETIFGEELNWTTEVTEEVEKNEDGIETTVKKPVVKVFEGLPAGSYKLRELVVPAGYVRANDIPFTVNEDGTVTADGGRVYETKTAYGDQIQVVKITMTDMDTLLRVTKSLEDNYELKDGEEIVFELAAAGDNLDERLPMTITLTKDNLVETEDEDGEKTYTYVSEDIRNLPAGDYTLTETKVPEGFTLAQPVDFRIEGIPNDDGIQAVEVHVDNTATEIEFSKVVLSGEDELPGATLQVLLAEENGDLVLDEEGKPIVAETAYGEKLQWVSEDTSKTVKGLQAGWYVLHEEYAPLGYAFSEDILFEIPEGLTSTDQLEKVEMTDEALHFTLNKTDVTDATVELDDAELTVYEVVTDEETGEETLVKVDSWTSKKGDVHDFGSLLKAGSSYVLREEAAPAGYGFVSDTKFQIEKDGTVVTDLTRTKDEAGNDIFLVEDTAIDFTVNKVDVNSSEELDGAVLTVYEKQADGSLKEVESWTSKKGEVHNFGGRLWADHDYVLRETLAPTGYDYVSDMEFRVEKDGSVTTGLTHTQDENGNTVFLVNDRPLHFTVNKTDVADATTELDGATLTVYEVVKDEETGEETLVKVDSWTSKKGEVHDFGSLLKAGSSYVLREEAAPQGYGFVSDTKFQIEKDGKVVTDLTRTKDEAGNEIFLVEDAAVDFTVNKVDVNSSEELDGAVLTVYEKQADGSLKEVESWTSKKGETHNFGGRLWAGRDYVLRETLAPTGYDYVSDIEFRIEKDGSVTTGLAHTQDESGRTVYLVNDRPLHLRVNKVDISNATTELAGAELTLYRVREDGSLEEVDKWVSKVGEIHDFGSKIEAGASYVLRETVAPDGYKYTSDITFNIAKDGTVTTTANIARDAAGNAVYLVEDGATRGSFSKVDAETGEQLAGAKLQITDAAGTVIEQWTTDGTAHIVTAKLAVGRTYTLTETEAPEFYETAQPITFTVAQDGTIPDVVMRDMRISSEGASIAVTKTLVYGGEAVNAVDETFYVALYEDEARTKLASDVKAIEFKNASSSTVRFTGLELGKPYYVGEADAQGTLVTSGVLADGTTYAANFNQGYRAEITQENGTVEVRFENELYTIPQNEFYKEGSLTITKRMLGADGRAMADNGTFYAGIFADAAHTTLSDRVSQNIVTLNLAGQSSVTQEVQVSMEPGEALTLYVAEVDASGVPVENDETFLYDVTVEGAEVTLTDSQNTAAAIITNQPVVPEDYYNEGELTITKMLLNAAGVETASNKVFYAGIFADPEYTTLSDRVSSNIVELALNGHSRATDSVKVSMEPGETVTLYVTEVSADGIPVDRSTSFRYDVTVEGAEVTMTNDTVGVTTITNQELEEEEEEETSFEEERSTEEGGSSDETIPAGTKAVKTGDETPIGLYLGLLLAAALVLILAFALRRRTRKQ